MPIHHPHRSLSRTLLIALAAGALAGTASAQTERRWRNPATGDWGTVGNWVSNLPPTSNETAFFGLNASVTSYNVTSAINRTTAGLNVNNQRPTFLFGSPGAPATYTISNFVTIGGAISPVATLGCGNVIAPANVMVGRNPGQPGSLVISGPESIWSGIDTIGQAATGEVSVTNGGLLSSSRAIFIGFGAGSSGLLRVDGANGPSRVQMLSNAFVVLGTDGNGRIELLNGGQMSVNNEQFYVGDRGTASLLISGAGSSLTLPYQLRLAENAPSVATATIQAGGSITAQGVEVGQRGQATLIVKDPGSQIITNFSAIGLNGNGTLEIRDGALFRVTSGELNIGRSDGATGSVLISGLGSTLDFPGWVRVGDNTGSLGSLTIENGATPTLGNPLMIGHQNGSTGSVTVRGDTTQFTSIGNLIVGEGGTGSLAVQNAAQVLTGSGLIMNRGSISLSGGASIQTTHGAGLANGVVTVASGSDLLVAGDMNISLDADVLVSGDGSSIVVNPARGISLYKRSTLELADGATASALYLVTFNDSLAANDMNLIDVHGQGSILGLQAINALRRNSVIRVRDGGAVELGGDLIMNGTNAELIVDGPTS